MTKLKDVLDTSGKSPTSGEKIEAGDTIDYAKGFFYLLTAAGVGATVFGVGRNLFNEHAPIEGKGIGSVYDFGGN